MHLGLVFGRKQQYYDSSRRGAMICIGLGELGLVTMLGTSNHSLRKKIDARCIIYSKVRKFLRKLHRT